MRWISIPLAFGAAFVDFGALALPSGEPFQKRQDGGVTLGIDSSCHDVENYQTANKLPRIQADMYEKLDAHAYLDYWFFNNTDEALTNYVNLFATPYAPWLVHLLHRRLNVVVQVRRWSNILLPDSRHMPKDQLPGP